MGNVGSAAFIGVSGLTIAVTSVGIVINKKASDNTVVDYKLGEGETTATSLAVVVAPGKTVSFGMDDTNGDYIQVAGSASINLFGFVTVTGGFGVESKTGQALYISSGATTANSLVSANLLTIGLSNVSAFVGFNGIGLQLDNIDLAIALWSEVLPGTRTWTSVMGNVGSAAFIGVSGLTIAVTSVGIVINKKASDNTVVDYKLGAGETNATILAVVVAPGKTVSFVIDDTSGDTIQVVGIADINLFGFVIVTGGFGVESKTGQTLYVSTDTAANETVTGANLLTIGLSNVRAFVGFNGIGLQLIAVDLAIALWSEVLPGTRNWTSVMGNVGSAAFIGVSGLTIAVTSVGIVINKKASDNTVVDYKLGAGETNATILAVVVAPGKTVSFVIDDTSGDTIQVVGIADINLFGFVIVTGGFGVESKTGQTLYVSTDTAANETVTGANLLTIGLSNVRAFVGFNGIGLQLIAVDLAIALWSEVLPGTRNWTSVMGNVGSAAFIGVSGLTIAVTSVGIVINKKASDNTVVDYKLGEGETTATSLAVVVAPGKTVSFGMDDTNGDYIQVAGYASINLFGFVTVTGGFGVEKSTSQSVVLSNGSATADLMTIGFSNASAFAGFGSVGLSLVNVDLALAIWSEVGGVVKDRSWSSVVGSVGSASFVGISGLTMIVTNASILFNRADQTDGSVVDYLQTDGESSATSLAVIVAPGKTVTFAMDDSLGDYMRLTGSVDINLFNFITLKGGFGVEKKTLSMPLADGSLVAMSVLAFGGENLSGFAGLKTSAGDIGLSLTGVTFALATFSPTDQSDQRSWFTMNASVGAAALVGIPLLSFTASDVSVQINQVSGTSVGVNPSTQVINYGASPLEVATGPGTHLTLNFPASDGQMLRVWIGFARIELLNFFYIQGSLALEKGPLYTVKTVGIPGVTSLEVETLTLGGRNLYAFVGIGGMQANGLPSDGSVGLSIQGLDFALALFKPTSFASIPAMASLAPTFLALKAHADFAGLVGLGTVVTAEIFDVTLEVNFLNTSLTPIAPAYIDFKTSFPAAGGYAVKTGAAPILINFDSLLIRASIGFFEMQVASVVYLAGSMALEAGPTKKVTLSDTTTKEVMIMTFGAANVYGFAGIKGPYKRDTNHDHIIDGNDTVDTNAVGLALENLNFAIMIMKAMPLTDPAVYFALQASLSSLALVGVTGVTASATELKVDINLAIGGIAVVDFVASFPAEAVGVDTDGDGKIHEPAGYEIKTGSTPIYLNYSTLLIAASGAVQMNLFSLVSLVGIFDFELSPTKLQIFADAKLRMIGGVELFSFKGLLVITSSGLAAWMERQVGVVNSALDFDVNLQLYINTTMLAYTYVVPDRFKSKVSYASITIPAGAPQIDGSVAAPSVYFVMKGSGVLRILSVVELTGDFYFKLASDGLRVTVTGTLRLPLIAGLGAVGDFGITSAGAFGSLQVGGGANLGLFDQSLFKLSGFFQFEFNTTASAQTVRMLDVNEDGVVVGLKNGTIAALTARLSGSMVLNLGGVFSVNGSVELVAGVSGFEVHLRGKVVLGGFGKVVVVGDAGIYSEAGLPVFASNISVAIDLGIPSVTITGTGLFRVNTSPGTTYFGVAPSSFYIHVDGHVQVLTFNMAASVTISFQNSVFRIALDNLDFNFFNFITVKISGFVQSDGQFEIYGQISRTADIFIVKLDFGLEVHIGNCNASSCLHTPGQGFTGVGIRIWGNITVNLFIAKATAGFDAMVELTESYAKVAISVNLHVEINLGLFTISFNVGFTWENYWSWGAPPVIARQVGDTVYLNMGVDGYLRDEPGKEIYKNIAAENVMIEPNGANGISVHSMGAKMDFVGVNHIVVTDFGSGTDSLIVDSGVNADLVAHGGDGNDTISYLGNGTALIYGDAGNDRLSGGKGVISTLYGGAGDDTLNGGEGTALLYGGVGNDALYGGNGNDTLYGEVGNDTLDGGGGNDVLYDVDGNNTLSGGVGDDLLTTGAGDDVLNGNDGNDELHAGAGNDTLEGGAGDDRFVFIAGYGTDTVTDAGGSGDTLDFTAITSVITVTFGNPTFTNTNMVVFSAEGTVTHPGETIDVFLSGSANDIFYGYAYGSGSIMLDGKAGDEIYNFYGGTGTFTVNDRGSAANNDIVYARGTSDADTITLHPDGFQYNLQRVYATGLTSGTMQGAELIDVRLEQGNNTLYVLGTSPSIPTIVTSLGGNDTFRIGYAVSEMPRMVLDLLGLLTIQAGNGLDRLFVDDRFHTGTRSGAMTSSTITGFGIALSIIYQAIEELAVYLGTGTNTFEITNTNAATINTVLGGSGMDTVTVQSTASQLTLDTGAGADTITVNSSGASGLILGGNDADTITINNTGGALTFDAGGGADVVIIQMTGGVTIFNGGDGADTITINNTGDTTTINGEHGDDIIIINNTGGATTINGDEGIDTFTVNNTGGATTINGGTSLDYFTFIGAGGTTVINGDRPSDNVANLIADSFTADGATKYFTPALIPDTDPRQDVLVWVNGTEVVATGNYSWADGRVTFTTAPASGALIQIIRICDPNQRECPGDDRFYIQGGGGSLTINGGWGADKYFVSSGVSKDSFTSNSVYNDDLPLPSMTGTLSGIIGALLINGWADGNGGMKDRLYVSELGSIANSTGTLGTVISGLSLPVGGSIGFVSLAQVEIQLGGGNNTFSIEQLAATTNAIIYGGSGNDTLTVGGGSSGLTGIQGMLTFQGQVGNDTLNVSDVGNALANSGQLTAINVTGLGMGANSWLSVQMERDAMLSTNTCATLGTCKAAIYFATRNGSDVVSSDVEFINILLGSGNDTFRVDSVYSYGQTSVYGGAGDDRIEIAVTVDGLHPNSLRRVDYINGALFINGEGGSDYVIVNDSGDSLSNTGYFEGTTVSGLGMGVSGSITFATAEQLEISLGEQNDTFYLRSAPAGVETRLKMNGGFDKVYVGNAANKLDEILGTLVIEGGLPFSKDELYLLDGGNMGSRTYTISNDPNALILSIEDPAHPGQMIQLNLDETTLSITGGGQIKYQTFETVVLNAGSGSDVLNLQAPHNDRDPLGGFNASFTFNGGAGDDLINVGSGASLDLIDIFVMFNGQGGNDSIFFDHTSSLVANTLAFVGKTFSELFVAATDEWATLFSGIFGETESVTRAAYYTAVVLGLVASPNTRVMNIGANMRDVENISVSLGSGKDVFKLGDGTYREAITVNGGAGNDTFNISNNITTQQMITLNGNSGDDLMFVDFGASAPDTAITITFNGGEHDTDGDMLRLVGDGIVTGDYRPSATVARAGRVTVKCNTFDFSGLEPLVVTGMGAFQLTGSEALSDVAIETVDVANMDLTTLVLHVLLVDGVISWRQQVKLDGVGAKDTNSFGQSLAWDGSTLVVGASRALVSITDKKPVDNTVTDFVKSANVGVGQTKLASGAYHVEMRDAGSADWEFRLLDASNNVVSIANMGSGGWQDVPTNKVIDTMRGLMIAFGANEAAYSAVSAASFTYNVGQFPGVVYVYTQSGSTWTEQTKLYAKDGEYAAQGFGSSVAISGDVLAVGAPQDNSLGANAGAVYIFQRSGADWWQAAKLKASDGAANDSFGTAVAVSGVTALAGAPGDDNGAGAVYVFQYGANAWAQKTKFMASDRAANDLFGAALAYVGGTAGIGAPGADSSRGSAYIFTGSGATWTQSAKLLSSSAQAGEQFGSALAMDSARIVIGAPYYDGKNVDQGAAFIYDLSAGVWVLSARLTADGGLPEALAQTEARANDHFGAAVALSGAYVIVGAPDYDGVSLNQGAVYPFMYLPDGGCGCGGTWIRSKNKLVSSTPTENDYFGKSLALNGAALVVGVPGFNETDANNNILREDVGTVRFYSTDGLLKLNDMTDTLIGLYRAEITAVSGGAAQAGYEMLYHTASRTLLVGAPGEGYVYVYANEGLYWRYSQTLSCPTPGCIGGSFGYDMDLSGSTLVVGAPGAGAAYVFTYSGGLWNFAAAIGGPGGTGDFGRSVAIEGGRIAVGAPGTSVWYWSVDSPYGLWLSASGAVFTYTGSGASWSYERFVMPYDGGMPNATYYWAYWTPYVAIYEHQGYGGVGIGFSHGDVPWICGEGCFPNDWISSIIVGPYTWAHFYSNYGLGGGMLPLGTGSYPDLGGWQDQISSFGMGCASDYQNPCRSIEPVGFSGLNGAQFGAEVELTGGVVYVGAPGLARLYSVNVAGGGYGYWATNFGTPLVATSYGGGYTSINEILYNNGVQWSGVDNALGITPNGARIIRSDPYADYDNGNGGSITDTGSSALYINGSLIGTLSSGDNSIKVFGLAPVFPAEAHYVIGTYNANRLFNFRQFGPVWTYTGSIIPEALPTSKFGSSVAIDGQTAVVGARDYDNRGAAFVFVRAGVEAETWTLQAKLQGLDTNKGNLFGSSVGVSGNTIIVGAPNANLDASGAAYIFERIGATWIQQAKLIASDSAPNRLFGLTAAISLDSAAVGAPGGSSVYVFVRNGFAWTQQKIFSGASGFGSSLALNLDTLMVGSPLENSNTGAAYVYTRANSIWTQQAKLTATDPSAGDKFGAAVALDGERAAVGAPGADVSKGAVYTFNRVDALWSTLQKLTLASGAAGDHFGNSISISGERMVIGAYLRDVARSSGGITTTYTDEGSAYAYGIKDGNWRLETVVEALQASDGYSGDMLGYAVAISGTLVLTGAPQFNGRIGGLPTDGGGYIYITEISPPLTVTQPEAVTTILNGAKAQKIRDTANSISPLYFFDVPSFTLDLSAGNKNDTITVDKYGLSAYALSSFIIQTGAGNDTLTVNSSSVRLPTAGKVRATPELLKRSAGSLTGAEAAKLYITDLTLFEFIAGDGSNTLNLPAADTDFTLSDTYLFDGLGGKLSLDGVSNISLTGGASANVFNILSWSGTVTLNGLGGSDRYLVNLGAVHTLNLLDSGSGPNDQDRLDVLGTDDSDTISIAAASITAGSSTLNYSNIEALTVAGLGGNDTLTLNALGVHEVTLDGGQGSDTYQINVAGSTLNVYAYDSGSVGTDQLLINGAASDDSFVVDTTQAAINTSMIYYDDSFEQFTVNGYAGNDRIIINGHPTVITTFLGGEGDDRFDVSSVKPNGIQLIDGQNGNDMYWLINPPALQGPVNISDSGPSSDEDYLVQAGSDGVENVTVTATGITGMTANLVAFLVFNGLEGICIDLLGGDDTISISGVPGGIALAVYGSAGNDSVFVSNLSGLPNFNLRLFGGDGSDSLSIDASAGNTGTLTGTALSGFNLLKSLVYQTFENITLNLSAGADTLAVSTTSVLSNVVVNTLAGLDQVTVVNTGAGSSLTVNLGSGEDQITLQAAGLNSTVQLNGEDGGDTFEIQSSPASSNLEINGGAGEDSFTFNGASGTTVLNAGLDNDLITVNSAGGNTTINGNEGNDLITVNSAGGNTTINGNEGDDVIHINKTDLSVDFHGIIDGQGGEDTLTFAGYSSGRDFLLTGLGAADGFNLAVTGIDALFKNINTLVGSAFADTLTGLAAASSWNLTGAKSGAYTSSAISLAFSAIESLLGGSGADSFIVADGIAFGGTINGGLGSNTLSYVGSASAHSVSLSGASSNGGFNGSATGIDGFSNLNSLLAGSGSDTLTGLNAIANWIVTAANALTYSSGSQSLSVSGFKNLIGGSGLDTLSFASLSAVQAVTVLALGTADGFKLASAYFTGASFENINTLIGGSGADSLAGLDATSSWNLTGAKTGTYTSSAISLAFSAIESLLGGTAADSFLVSAAAFGGTLDGGLGSDTLSYLGSVSAHLVTLSGAGTNGFNGTASGIDGFSNINILLGGSGLDTLTGPNVDTVWTLSGSPSLTSGGQTLDFSSFETLRGGSAGDTFRHTVSTPLTFNLDGGLGEDTFDYSTWSNPVTLNLAAGTVTALVGTFSSIEDLIGGSGNDILTGDGGNNVLTGGPGTDTLAGGAGNDTYCFGNGWGSDNPVIELTGAGTDTFDFSAVTVSLTFTFSPNSLTISDGTNSITHTGGFMENLIGGLGIDTLDYSRISAAVTVNLGTGLASGPAIVNNTLSKIENIIGSAYNDTLTGSDADNALVGGGGNDSLDGGAGFDTVDYSGSSASVNVNLSSGRGTGSAIGSDSLARIEKVIGSAFDDWFVGSGVNETFVGGSGLDTLDYSNSTATVNVDLALGSASGTGSGTDTLSGIENLVGSAFDDWFVGSNVDNSINGGAGQDTIDYSGSSASVRVDLTIGRASGSATGTDTLLNIENITGSALNDWLIGSALNNVIDGGLGIDTIDYSGSSAAVTVNLGTGNASGSTIASDTLSNIENIIGSAYNDSLTGSNADNVLLGGGGNDALDGGAGFDTVDYSASSAFVNVNLSSGIASGTGIGTDSLLRLEKVIGSAYDDLFVGTGVNESFVGGLGRDTIDYSNSAAAVNVDLGQGIASGTGSGTDTLSSIENLVGSPFDDHLAGSSLDNRIDGGAGTDTIDYSGSTAFVTVNLSSGVASGSAIGTDSLLNIENITGSAYADLLTGNALDNVIDGGAGADTIDYSGSARAVSVNLGSGSASGLSIGSDTLRNIENIIGSAQADILIGSAADNVITGGLGNDDMAGLAGNDTYILSDTSGVDTIVELVNGGIDTLDYSARLLPLELTLTSDLVALFESFIGGMGNDRFIIESGVLVPGLLDGGGGNNTLDLSAFTQTLPVTLTSLGTAVGFSGTISALAGGFKNITSLLLSAHVGNQLTGANVTAEWLLSEQKTKVSSAGQTLEFTGFTGFTGGSGDDTFIISDAQTFNLAGGAGNDTFIFENGALLDGEIDGGPGLDTLDFSNYKSARSIKLTGYSHDDDAFIGRDASLIPALTGIFSNINGLIGSSDPNNNDSLTGIDYNAHWNLGNGGTYAVNPTLTFSSFKTLVGGGGSDTFEVSGVQNVSIQGEGGDDAFIFNPGSQVNGLDGGAGNDQIEYRVYDNITNVPGANSYVLTKIDGVEVETVTVVSRPPAVPVIVTTTANTDHENSDRGSGSQSVATFISQNIVLLANGSSTLQLANGIQVSFAARVGTLANISLLQPGNLPSLPGKYGYRSGLNIQVWNGSQSVAVLKHGMTVSFALPVDTGAGHNLILFWDQSANNGLGGWAEVTTTLVSRLVNGVIVSTLEVTSTNTGTYILVTETNPSAAGN